MNHLDIAVAMSPFLLAALMLAMVFLWIFARHHGVGVGLLLAAQVWSVVAHGKVPALSFGLHAYPADILAACACLVAFFRLLRRRLQSSAGILLVLGMVVLTVSSVVRGIGVGGFQAAANDSRVSFFQVLAFVLYVATAPADSAMGRVISRGWLAAGVAYVLLSLVRWGGSGLHSVGFLITVADQAVDSRPVPANVALMLLQGAILLLCPLASSPWSPRTAHGDRPGTGYRRLIRFPLALLLLVCVILLQHRTVWAAAAAVAVVYWASRPSRAGQRTVAAAAGILIGFLALACFRLGAFGSVGSTLAASLADTQTTHSTFTWRVYGWEELLNTPRPWDEWFFGSPFSAGYARIVEGRLTLVDPHDYFVHVALRLGLTGLALLLAVYVLVLRHSHRAADGLALRLLVVSQLVFCVTYSVAPEQGVLLGLCLWQIRVCAVDRRTGPASARVPRPPAGREVAKPRARAGTESSRTPGGGGHLVLR